MTKLEWIKEIGVTDERDSELISRAYDTLMANVYPAEGFLWSPYRCITPGLINFDGIWNWDSAFHAAGVARFDTELAKDSVLGFLQFQREDGLLPDCILEDNSVISGYGKPPLFAWASEIIYKRDKDIKFLKKVYKPLVKNEEFWVKSRCYEGLFFYDAEDPDNHLRDAKYESGWDNSVRWDKGITEYWAVDLNCFMVMYYRSLSFIAKELGYTEDSKKWDEKEKNLISCIDREMWDPEKGYYADINRFTRESSDVLSPASFMPLYISIASEEQAKAMDMIARNNFKCKMPTVSFDNIEYSNDYWRGPTWLNVAYFAAKGLKNYGLKTADEIRESILNMCYEDKRGIFENYDSVTGKGLCCDHFSWSSVFVIEFILNW